MFSRLVEALGPLFDGKTIGLNFFTNPGTEDFDCLYCLRGGGVGVCRKKVFKMEIWEIKVFKARIKGSLNR